LAGVGKNKNVFSNFEGNCFRSGDRKKPSPGMAFSANDFLIQAVTKSSDKKTSTCLHLPFLPYIFEVPSLGKTAIFYPGQFNS
jgi:hypothetical protein